MAIPETDRFDLYLDTSAINWLYNHLRCRIQKDPIKFAKEFAEKYRILLSAVNIAEICATSDDDRRKSLLQFCWGLVGGGDEPGKNCRPAAFPGELLRRAAIAYAQGDTHLHVNLQNGELGLWYALLHPDKVQQAEQDECYRYKEHENKW